MIVFIVKILSLLVYPLSLALLLGVLSLILLIIRFRKLSTLALVSSFSWLYFWSLPLVADYVTRTFEVQYKHVPLDMLPVSDVIVVFGGVMRSPQLAYPYPDLSSAADRVWHAARLFHSGRAAKVILSGGRNLQQIKEPSEADNMSKFLIDLGVPIHAIIIEDRSLNTYENAIYCTELICEMNMESAILVTSALHMPRSVRAFNLAGVVAVPSPTDFEVVEKELSFSSWVPSAQALQLSSLALHEMVGIAVYRLRGWL